MTMPHIRWAALGLALALLAARDQDSTLFHGQSPARPVPSEIEGIWEVVSVHRNGEADPVQVGAHLTFANGKVTFLPKVKQIDLKDMALS
jgi:hypothetical protein